MVHLERRANAAQEVFNLQFGERPRCRVAVTAPPLLALPCTQDCVFESPPAPDHGPGCLTQKRSSAGPCFQGDDRPPPERRRLLASYQVRSLTTKYSAGDGPRNASATSIGQRFEIAHQLPPSLLGEARPGRHSFWQIAVGEELDQRGVRHRLYRRRVQTWRSGAGRIHAVARRAMLREEFASGPDLRGCFSGCGLRRRRDGTTGRADYQRQRNQQALMEIHRRFIGIAMGFHRRLRTAPARGCCWN